MMGMLLMTVVLLFLMSSWRYKLRAWQKYEVGLAPLPSLTELSVMPFKAR
jgi:hypothetical protein